MRTCTTLTTLIFVTGLSACDDALEGTAPAPACVPGFVESDDGCVFDEAAVADLMRHFDDGQLVKINDEPFEQVMGPGLVRNVWVSPVPLDNAPGTAVDLYRLIDPFSDVDLPVEFPIGTLIIHETVDRIEGHTVQVKLGDDYADENGRTWWFGKYFDDGTPDEAECSPCIMCHNSDMRPATDGLYGVTFDARPGDEG